MKIADMTNFTLQDYPNHTACIIWLESCNMRCKYCHNVEFVDTSKNTYENTKYLAEEEVLRFLKKRVGLFDGVVFSGGECTLATNLENFIKQVRELGFKIKIDTNGLIFDKVKYFVENKLIDFVALDFKAPKYKFNFITQIDNEFYDNFEKTLKYLIKKNNENALGLEIRTTVHTDLLEEHDINLIIDILDDLNYRQTFFVQNFRHDEKDILTDLRDQVKVFDRSKVKIPKNFKLDYRNFF